MKRFQSILLMLCLALCGVLRCLAQESSPQTTALSPAAMVPGDQASTGKARLLIQQAIEALGGASYLGIRDMQQQGRTYSFHHGQTTSNGVLFWRFVEFPDKERLEVTKQRDVSYVYAGDKGYEITYKGSHPVEAKELSDYLRRRKFSLDTLLRQWVQTSGVAFFYEGSAISGNRPAEQVTLVNPANDAVTLFLDPANHLPLGKRFYWRDPVDKQRNMEEETYDNYRLVGGVMTPYNLTRYYNGDMSNQRFLNTASYNQGLAPAMFDPNAAYDPNKPPSKH